MEFLSNTDVVSKIRWVLIGLAGLLVLIFIGWGIARLTQGFFSNSSSNTVATVNQSVADDQIGGDLLGVRTIRYTLDGPVVATQDHRSYTIEVSSSTVLMRVYSNYGQIVIDEKTYSNNDEAYLNFIEALERRNVTSRIKGTNVEDDFAEKGVCASGRRHILEIGDEVRRWFTSCKTLPGTAGANMNAVRRLFVRQVPDFEELTEGTGLRLPSD